MADRDGPSFDRWSEVGDLFAVNGGWNMHRCGGVKMMEWTPPPDGIAMCQGGGAFEPPERGGIHGRG